MKRDRKSGISAFLTSLLPPALLQIFVLSVSEFIIVFSCINSDFKVTGAPFLVVVSLKIVVLRQL